MNKFTPITESIFKNTCLCIEHNSLENQEILKKYYGLPIPLKHWIYQGRRYDLFFELKHSGIALKVGDIFELITALKKQSPLVTLRVDF